MFLKEKFQRRIEEWSSLSPQQLISATLEEYGSRAAIMTSTQNTGIVIIDMAKKSGQDFRVITVDTLRLFPETYALIQDLNDHFGIEIEVYKPDPDQVGQMVKQRGEYLFFDSMAKQQYCCRIRKEMPRNRALQTVDAYLSGIRSDQSVNREQNAGRFLMTEIDGQPKLQIAPLLDWSEQQVNDYIRANALPSNPLFDEGYKSIGCVICTTPVLEGEDSRSGRWRWLNSTDHKKECGINVFRGEGEGI